jgi:arginine/ornithine transport system substrate-binding protein
MRLPLSFGATCAAAALVLALLFGQAQAHAQQGGKLRIGVEGAYPPFSELGTDGKIKGFDIDIANALCARIKLECVPVQAEFDAMIPALKAKKIDAIVASMSITPERAKAVDFTDKYYQTPARFVLKTDSKIDIGDAGLKGKRIGVQRNTIHDRYATAMFKSAEIVRYAKQDEVFLDLVNGRIDASLADSVAIDQGFLKTPAGKGYAFRGPNYTDPKWFGIGAGIAVRKGDAALLKQLNEALAAIRGDGTYKQIAAKYFDFDVYGGETKK